MIQPCARPRRRPRRHDPLADLGERPGDRAISSGHPEIGAPADLQVLRRSSVRKAQSPSSTTTSVASPSGGPSSRSRRPVVIVHLAADARSAPSVAAPPAPAGW